MKRDNIGVSIIGISIIIISIVSSYISNSIISSFTDIGNIYNTTHKFIEVKRKRGGGMEQRIAHLPVVSFVVQ